MIHDLRVCFYKSGKDRYIDTYVGVYLYIYIYIYISISIYIYIWGHEKVVGSVCLIR